MSYVKMRVFLSDVFVEKNELKFEFEFFRGTYHSEVFRRFTNCNLNHVRISVASAQRKRVFFYETSVHREMVFFYI